MMSCFVVETSEHDVHAFLGVAGESLVVEDFVERRSGNGVLVNVVDRVGVVEQVRVRVIDIVVNQGSILVGWREVVVCPLVSLFQDPFFCCVADGLPLFLVFEGVKGHLFEVKEPVLV